MIKCPQPQAHPDRCGCKPEAPDAFEIARHSKRLVEQQRERIAALEAECERLRSVMMTAVTNHFAKGWSRAAKEKELDQYLSEGIRQLEAERDALAAELRAHKAQMAEPVAWTSRAKLKAMSDMGVASMWPKRIADDSDVALYAAPPAAQDVSGLIEALEWCEDWFSKHCPTSKVDGFLPIVHPMLKSIRNALAAHRQAQQQVDQPPPASRPRQT